MVLAMTHEEIVTMHVAQVVRSYRDLPQILYHFQTKERDEPRPRAGVLRTREFIMKDAYTFDRDPEGLDVGYRKHAGAYERIFDRAGLEWYAVESDVGMMGGTGAHEYMAPCAAGEDDVALAPGYAANVQIARAEARPVGLPPGLDAPEQIHTPGATTVAAVTEALGVEAGALLKAFPVLPEDGRGLTLIMVRGDHRVNETKLRNVLGTGFRPARADEFEDVIGPAGYIGPVGAGVPILLDEAVARGGYVTGANAPDAHLRGVEPGRDFPFERADVRVVEAGDTVNGAAIRIEPAIEIGNIFKLGTRYSEPLGATYLDEAGKQQLDPHGLLRDRPRADRGRRGRAVRRRARHLLAPLARRRGTSSSSGWARRARRSASSPTACTRSCAGRISTCSTTTAPRARARSSPTPSSSACPCGSRSGAARWSRASSRRRCGAAASSAASRSTPRRRPPTGPAGDRLDPPCGRGGGGAVAEPPVERARLDLPPALGARPLRPAAAADARGAAAEPVDDPERDRLRAAGADPGLPDPRLQLGRRDGPAARDHLRPHRLVGLPGRDRRAGDRPVLAARDAAGPARGPAARALRA